jgi:cytoskeletal protein RodZ
MASAYSPSPQPPMEGCMATTPLEKWRVADIRQTKGISLEQISSITKLRISTLQAIEDGDFDALPGGIYNISYIRQYARAIDADESHLIQLYRLQHQIAS